MPFSQKTLEFLAENRIQDSKAWFDAHRAQYQEFVLEPLLELAGQLEPVMREIDPLLVTEPKVDKTISRIRRDTRFSHDKSLYREVMWCAYTRDKKEFDCPPGFVLELWPDGFHYGCGYYQAPPKIMEQIRKLILADDPAFQAAREACEGQNIFQLEGEKYKRAHYPDKPEALRDWLERRNLDWMHESRDFELLFSAGLWKTLAKGFETLRPFYEFLCKANALANGA